MKKKAFITGISVQDGSYLSEYLLENDYTVFGILRRNSITEHPESIKHKRDASIANAAATKPSTQ